MNRPILVEGSWPESDDECLLSVDKVWTSPVHIGDTVELLEGTSRPGWRVHHPYLYRRGFRAVLVLHVHYQYGGATSLGSGAASHPSLFVPEGAFAADYPYTEAFLTVDGAAGAHGPIAAYQERVDAVAQRLNDLSPR